MFEHTNFPDRQRGISIFKLIFILGFFGFLGLTATKLFPLYYQQFQINSVLDNVATDSDSQHMTPMDLKRNAYARIRINQVYNVGLENFTAKRVAGVMTLTLKYEHRTQLIANLDAVLSYDKTIEFLPQ